MSQVWSHFSIILLGIFTIIIMARTLFKDYGNRETQRPQEEVKQTMRDITQQYLEEMEQDSILFQKIAVRSIPALSHCGKQWKVL